MARRIVLTLMALVTVTGLVAACAPTGAEQAPGTPDTPTTVTLAMGYIPNVQFAPFYVAVAKGYFADEGIPVKFDYGWETDLLKLVGSDDLQFAVASGDQVILARSQGLPVVYVMDWYRRFPVSIVSLASAGIHGPADLAGKRIGTPVTYGASYIGWRALLEATGLKESDEELVTIGYTQVAALEEGQVDAAICYAMNEPVQMQVAGEEINSIYVADYANLVSNGLITNEKTIAAHPDLVQGMVRAALRGLAYTIDHPDEAFQIAGNQVPEIASDAQAEQVNRAILAESIKFWQAPAGELGRSVEAEWATSQQIMQTMGLVGSEANVADMFTNRFVDGAQP
jgi:NitT/TauT family transport system substrate-binding protein